MEMVSAFALKPFLSALAIALTLFAFYPYLRGILVASVKPHVFSWVIWGITTFIVFLAQLKDGAGIGAWPIGISGTLTILIAILAYLKRSDVAIRFLDWTFFILALSSLPLWYLTSDPLWAVVVLTMVDLLGFGSTIRKAYSFPRSESPSFYALFMIRNLIVISALENYSVTTVLFPAAISVACAVLISLIVYRQRIGAF